MQQRDTNTDLRSEDSSTRQSKTSNVNQDKFLKLSQTKKTLNKSTSHQVVSSTDDLMSVDMSKLQQRYSLEPVPESSTKQVESPSKSLKVRLSSISIRFYNYIGFRHRT